ncbi:MAG: DUF1016 N-terminal domain-containing protein, partial [Treponema sp.]|nr:DUF1016 N-terminal domain-containing protein [Treponema sp.]
MTDISAILQEGRSRAYTAVNFAMTAAYWEAGKRIVEQEQHGKERANYGDYLIRNLSIYLGQNFDKGFSVANLKNNRQFYLTFQNDQKGYTLCSLLSWSHIRLIMRLDSEEARHYYLVEAREQNWSVRVLEDNMPEGTYIIGAIAGDIIGSAYEFNNVKSPDFEMFRRGTCFTDDSVLTIATMYALLKQVDYTRAYQKFGRRYPHRGYGGHFGSWIYAADPKPYNSWGNGSAMRASPIGWYSDNIDVVLSEARKSAEVTHNHPEGIKGAQAAAAAVYLARMGKSKNEIKQYIADTFDYNLDRTLDEIRPDY